MDLKQRLAELKALGDAQGGLQGTPLLEEEFSCAEALLLDSSDYEELALALRMLRMLGPQFGIRLLPALAQFVASVPGRTLTLHGEPLPPPSAEYCLSSSLLTWIAFEVSLSTRHGEPQRLLQFLLGFADSNDEGIRTKADETLAFLAAVDQNTVRPDEVVDVSAQRQIVDYFQGLSDETFPGHKAVLLTLLGSLLMPSIEGHPGCDSSIFVLRRSSHYYLGLEESRGKNIKASGGVPELRSAAIGLLQRLYVLDPDLSVLDTLFSVARRRPPFEDAETEAMIERDAQNVLAFFRDRIAQVDLRQILNIESGAYYTYYRNGSSSMARAALSLREVIYRTPHYAVYSKLFGGFGEDWKRGDPNNKEKTPFEEIRAAIDRFVADIEETNDAEWRERILEIAKVESSPATSAWHFCRLLRLIGQERPGFALELLEHSERMRPYLANVLQGLWSSARRDEAVVLALQWVKERKYLREIGYSLNGEVNPSLSSLTRLLDEAVSDSNLTGTANG